MQTFAMVWSVSLLLTLMASPQRGSQWSSIGTEQSYNARPAGVSLPRFAER